MSNYDVDDPYALGEDARKEYEQAGSNLLIEPDSARTINGKKFQGVQWPELCQVKEIEFKEPGLENPETPGDTTFLIQLTLEVAPESEVAEGEPSPNPGKRVYARMRYNLSSFKRAKANNTGFSKGQAAMTQMSNAMMREFLGALGMETDLGLTPRVVAFDYRDQIVGQKVYAKIKQGLSKGQDRKQTDVAGFLPSEV